MRTPQPEHIADAIKDTHPQLAIDVLRACGYTKRAARRAILLGGGSGEAASLVVRPATPTCKRNTA